MMIAKGAKAMGSIVNAGLMTMMVAESVMIIGVSDMRFLAETLVELVLIVMNSAGLMAAMVGFRGVKHGERRGAGDRGGGEVCDG